MRDLFLLDPEVVFLNHGSFGACPAPVFEIYQQWQWELERQPVEFIIRRSDALLQAARNALGDYVNADADDLIFVPNATVGVNTVARSLSLRPEDEVLTTDHEYGAIEYTWRHICNKTGASYVPQKIPLPLAPPEVVVDAFWQGVTPRTKVIAISHITSPTALIFPVAEICRRAREAGILTVVDGAHVPGQIPLDLAALGADFYAATCHKWLCAPKGSGFLYARREHHALIEPLIVSWGWPEETFVKRNQWQGTRDLSAFLSVPAAIEFQRQHHWDMVRRDCHVLAAGTRERINALTGAPPLAPHTGFAQMFSALLPGCDVIALTARLYDLYRVEIPGIVWNGQPLIRVSFQGYNTQADANRLVEALAAVLRDGYTENSM